MVLSSSRGFFSVAVLSVSNCFDLSRRCPFLGNLVCHGVVLFSASLSVTVLSASRGVGLSPYCSFLGILVCHGVVASRDFSLSWRCPLLGVCHGVVGC